MDGENKVEKNIGIYIYALTSEEICNLIEQKLMIYTEKCESLNLKLWNGGLVNT